ncbi:MAG: hypothetical protein Q8797_00280, partial [Candidatus Phytoplasma australasiaticum]|nr:hypothetical protein [Candidatus Phytoplasma australasiaticum]
LLAPLLPRTLKQTQVRIPVPLITISLKRRPSIVCSDIDIILKSFFSKHDEKIKNQIFLIYKKQLFFYKRI